MQQLIISISHINKDSITTVHSSSIETVFWNSEKPLNYALHFVCQKSWNIVFQTVPMFVWLMTMALSRPLQYNFIAKCQYNCTKNVFFWCQVHSSHIHSNNKTSLNYNNGK